MLISAGLAPGKSIVHGIAPSEDILATLDCLASLGANYIFENGTVTIEGTNPFSVSPSELHCRESGSTLRFFIPICLLSGKKHTLYGSETLLSRPLSVYEDICKEQNLRFTKSSSSIELSGVLSPGSYRVKGNISSQFISGLLFALPLLDGDSTISIAPPIESLSYINLTIQALSDFGVKVEWTDERTLFVKGNQSYIAHEVSVEGDYSNAAFFEALNMLDGNVSIGGLSPNSLQGDRVYSRFFEMLSRGTPTIHISDCPDLGPILFAVAACKNGGVFTGTRRLKIKESDRAASMAEELQKFGVSVKMTDDSVVVYPAQFYAPKDVLYGHNDHRIVMSLSVLLTLTGGEIDGAEAVSKSMPDFFDKLKSIGIEVKEYADNQ